MRLGDDNSLIISTTPEWGTALDLDAGKDLLKATQFEGSSIAVQMFTLLSDLDSLIYTQANAVYVSQNCRYGSWTHNPNSYYYLGPTSATAVLRHVKELLFVRVYMCISSL